MGTFKVVHMSFMVILWDTTTKLLSFELFFNTCSVTSYALVALNNTSKQTWMRIAQIHAMHTANWYNQSLSSFEFHDQQTIVLDTLKTPKLQELCSIFWAISRHWLCQKEEDSLNINSNLEDGKVLLTHLEGDASKLQTVKVLLIL